MWGIEIKLVGASVYFDWFHVGVILSLWVIAGLLWRIWRELRRRERR